MGRVGAAMGDATSSAHVASAAVTLIIHKPGGSAAERRAGAT